MTHSDPVSNTDPLSKPPPPMPMPNPTPKSSGLISWVWSTVKYLLIFLVIYTVFSWWRQPVQPAHPVLKLSDYQGQVVDMERMSHESPVLVYFWGSWCGVCKVTSPTINTLAQSNTYPVVSIAVQSGDADEIAHYLTTHDYQFTTINDKDGKIFSNWEGQVTPSYVILKEGEMVHGMTGIQPEWSLRLRLWIWSLL